MPVYTMDVAAGDGGRKKETVVLEKIKQAECPVSFLSRAANMVSLDEDVNGALVIQQMTGSMVYGPDSGKWPCRWYDAVMLTRQESQRVSDEEDRIKGMF